MIANIGSVAFEVPQELSVDEEKSKWKKRRGMLRKSKNLTTGETENLFMKVPRKPTSLEKQNSIDAVTGNLASSSSDDEIDCQLCPGIGCIADQ
jgi:hypothetical protein